MARFEVCVRSRSFALRFKLGGHAAFIIAQRAFGPVLVAHCSFLLVLNVKWSLLDFVVNAPDVFTHDSDGHELNPAEEDNGGHERCPAGNSRSRAKELFKNGPDEYAETYNGREKACIKTF